MNLIIKIIIFIITSISNSNAGIKSGICKPYFVSIKVSEVNLHVGPGKNYKVLCKYISKFLPVLITAKYDHWRRIQDPEGTVGWLHKSQLSTRRYVLAMKSCYLRENSNETSKVLATIKKNVVMRLQEVRGNWCKISIKYKHKTFKGWIYKSNVFGVLTNETWKE